MIPQRFKKYKRIEQKKFSFYSAKYQNLVVQFEQIEA